MAVEATGEWFRLMCESSPDFMVVIDRKRCFRWVNRLHPGLTLNDVIGAPLEKFEHPDTHARSRAATEKAFETGVAQNFDSHAVMPDGTETWYQVRCLPLAGRPDRLLLVTTDVTERRKAERERDSLQQQLFHSQKMDALGRLASAVAHDFNNLLTPMLVSSQLAMQSLDASHAAHELVAEVHQAAARASELTRQLLTIGKDATHDAKEVDLALVVRDMHRILMRLVPRDIRIEVSGEEGQARAWVDRGQLEQVLLNLVVNARDAMPDGGTLRVRTLRAGDRALVEVEDEGGGIDDAIQARIFEPFFSTKGEQGTGLGLAIVHGIVQQAGGTIDFRSRRGEGATFRVALPMSSLRTDEPQTHMERSEVRARAAPAQQQAPALAGVRVLVVDDEPLVCNLVVRQLRMSGCEVTSSTDAVSSLELAVSLPKLDLLVCDVLMPALNGPALAQRILAHHRSARVLFMSGYSGGILSEVDLQGVRLLRKPFSLDELVTEVRLSLQ